MQIKITLENLKQILEDKGFTLLTTEYKRNSQKLDVLCSKGHIYHPTAKSIKRGGCSVCYNETSARMKVKACPEKLQEAIDIAKSKGGECLSDSYINNRSKLKFRCSNGHEWETTIKCIKKAWCPICYLGGSSSDKFKTAQETAIKRGGKLISDNISFSEKLIWECDAGHTWSATYQNVIYKYSWCPYCNSSFSENICRQYLEAIFEKKFIKIRPTWLVNNSGRAMELDGYCEELGLAFEHQGLQHYETITSFSENIEAVQKRDEIKKNLCNKFNIILLEIPALFYLTAIDDLHTVISSQLDKSNIKYDLSKLKPVTQVIDLDVVNLVEKEKELQKIKDIAKSKGGVCLSTNYTGYNCKVDLCCEYKHTWTTTAASIKNNHHWCPICSHKGIITIEDMQKIATERGGLCLSKEYINNHLKLEWQCACGNIWLATYNNIQSGKWCPKCGVIKRSKAKHIGIEAYQLAAEKKGGKCLSAFISGCYDKLKFECALGHKWFCRADQMKNTNKWCSECAKIKRQKSKHVDK
jgi:hypothetical protein